MRPVRIFHALVWAVCCLAQVTHAVSFSCTVSTDGPAVLGGTVTFKVDLFKHGKKSSDMFKYSWRDDSLQHTHRYESQATFNTTSYWSVSYPKDTYSVGIYNVEVIVKWLYLPMINIWREVTSCRTQISITAFLNGNIKIQQSNKTLDSKYVSSTSEAALTIDIRKGDLDYLTKNATTIMTYWFINCKYSTQTSGLTFVTNFTKPMVSDTIEALVIASFEPPQTTTIAPPTTTTIATTTLPPNATTPSSNSSVALTVTTTENTVTTTVATTMTTKSVATSTENSLPAIPEFNMSAVEFSNHSIPFQCLSSSIIPLDPNKTYGYFSRQIETRVPITNVSVEGTNWIQPWDMLSLNVTCQGSGPFWKCLQFHRGKYNVTGNETCSDAYPLKSCNFSIIHYFLEPSVYTILVILNNEVSKQVYPLVINIYKGTLGCGSCDHWIVQVTTKPQLSIIVVPVSCTLVAVVLIIFGVSYYIQSRSRFTIEVADFDFGHNNPEMEYKTFTERLRNSFNNTGYRPLSNPETAY